MSDNFDWDQIESDARVVNEARETVAYLNPMNEVVIRQRADWSSETQDPVLVIPLHRVRALIERLDALLLEGQSHACH
jgi:hypothetical protein